MKKFLKTMQGFAFLAAFVGAGLIFSPGLKSAVFPPADDSDIIVQAFQTRTSNVFVEAPAKVVWVYPEVDENVRYQEFAVRLENGHRMRIRHSLDEARRVPLQKNLEIRFRGEFDWTSDGGLIHWTHDDPAGLRDAGWIEVDGKRYL